jgi:hypothetical protein
MIIQGRLQRHKGSVKLRLVAAERVNSDEPRCDEAKFAYLEAYTASRKVDFE